MNKLEQIVALGRQAGFFHVSRLVNQTQNI